VRIELASGECQFRQGGIRRSGFEIKREFGERERLAGKIHPEILPAGETLGALVEALRPKGLHLRLDQWSQKLLITNSACLRDPRRFGKILQKRWRLLPKGIAHGTHKVKVLHCLAEADVKDQEVAKQVGRHAHRVRSANE
jgi:hypothetical protein